MPGFLDDWPGWRAAGRQYLGPHFIQGLENAANLASFFSPATDVRDAMQASGDTMSAVRSGDYAGAAAAAPWIPMALAGAMLPGRPGAARVPMDEASRMARAEDGAFTIDAYRGEGVPISGEGYKLSAPGRVDPGQMGTAIYATNSPDVASYYATRKAAPALDASPHVVPLKIRMKNPLVVDMKEKENLLLASQDERDAWLQSVQAKGHDGVVVRYPHKDGDKFVEEYVVPDPAQIRSRFAAFDPAKAGSSDLLAGIAGAGLLGASSFMEDR